MVRFWAGEGFAFDACFGVIGGTLSLCAKKSSVGLRNAFQKICLTERETASSFLNQLINHVNWTVSEFDHSLEEIRKSSEERSQDVDQIYRKCTVTFELSVNLLRLVEATVLDGKDLFIGSSVCSTLPIFIYLIAF